MGLYTWASVLRRSCQSVSGLVSGRLTGFDSCPEIWTNIELINIKVLFWSQRVFYFVSVVKRRLAVCVIAAVVCFLLCAVLSSEAFSI